MEEELGDENVENEAKRHREDTPGEASAICACQERDQQGPPAAAELHHDAAEDRHEAAALDDIPALAAEEVDAAFLPLGPEAGPAADDMPGAAPASTDAAASEQVAPAQGRAAAGPAPSQAQSEMQPQCAVILGAALAAGRGGGATVEQEAAPPPVEPELSTNSPLDAATPSRQCAAVREELAQCLHPPTELGVPWDAFPNYLGEGARSRLLSLATLYLTAAGGRAPAAVRELAANSQRVLLGAANNCELYQERVVRALAQRMGVPLLVADAYSLKLDDVVKEEAPPTASFDELFGGGGGFTPDLGSDDEDFLTDIDKKDDKDRAASGRAAMRKPPFPTHRASVSVASLVPHVDRVRANANRVLAAAEAKQAAATKLAAAAMQAAGAAPAAKRGAASEQPQQGRPADMDQAAPAEEAGPSAVPPLIPEAEADAADKAAAQVVTEGVEPKLADKAGAAAAGAWGGAAAGADKAARSGAATEQASAARPAQEGKPRAAATATAAAAEGTGLQRAGSVDKAPGLPPSGLGAGAGQAAAAFKRGDRVSYLGRLPPGGSAAAERLEAIQAAISRMEAAGQSSRLRDYLPTIVLKSRSAALARQAERGAPQARMQLADAPPIGAKGRVVGLAGEKVEVVFEDPFPGGMSLVGQRERCGWACPPGDLAAAGDDREDAWLMSFTALFDVIKEEGEKGPLVVFVQNLDRLIRSSATDHFRKLEALLGGLPQRCLFFAAYCSRSLAREPTRPGGLGGMRLLGLGGLGGGAAGDSLGSALDDLPEIYRYGRLARGGAGSRKSSKGRTLACMLPNHIELHPPNQESLMKAWKQMVDADVAAMRTHANRVALRKALAKCGMACDDLEAVSIPDSQLGKREVEQLVGVAVAEQLAAEGERGGEEGAGVGEEGGSMEVQGEEEAPEGGAGAAEAAAAPAVDAPSGAPEAGPAEPAAAEGPRQQHVVAAAAVQQPPWELRATHIMAAAEAVRRLQAEAAAQSDRASALSQMAGDQYEKQLLSEVIPPEEISVQFDDIGALEQVKTTLHEVVILPLQRPELFTRGALTKPTKGLLLFGPPGTGKTMLAKAVASESGAHFINVNMSSLGSKWFGEGERLVRALFALAHKLAPSVVFVDEIDSFLSKRGDRGSEHEALRKMKNEFMSHWDGLRTKQNDRVLVLAATNRPMDLDDAVIRRMPRRIFVPLPDAANREKILRVILKDEELEPGFDFAELAAATDGYSGSDLKNLCIAAAYCPIREFLDAEREAKRAEAAAGASRAQPQRSVSQQPSQQPSQQQAPAAGGDGLARSASGSGRPPLGRPSVAAVAHVAPQPVAMRAICMADFKQAAKQVTASSCSDSATMSELKRWNDQYGEGGSRQKEQLAYYT